MSNQGLLQQSIRDYTNTALSLNGDWLALFANDGIATGTFNERLLTWINSILGASYTSLPDAQQAFAVEQGYSNWSTMATIILSGAADLLSGETDGLAIDFTDQSAMVKD